MEFLEADESSLLHSILASHLLIAHESSRAEMLINCGLASLLSTLSFLDRSAALFVNELCAVLSQPQIVIQPEGKPGLIALLDYLSLPPYDVDLSPGDKKFLEQVKEKCLQWFASQPLQQLPIVDRTLAGGDGSDLLHLRARTAPIIDRERLIVNYGLYSLMAEFASRVNYGTAAAFTIGGDFVLLKGYLLERMRRSLKERVPGLQQWLEVSLDAEDIAGGNEALMRKVLLRNACEALAELFHRYPKAHVVLVTWCYAITSQQMEMQVARFWKQVEESVLPLLQAQHRCFVMVIANVEAGGEPYQIDKFTALAMPSRFDMADLLPWMRGRLEELGIEQDDIKTCLERLSDQRGDLTRTYHELEYMVGYLREKYRR